MSEATERVTMLWPVELKRQVRERVGQRGLTTYAVEAVRMRLEGRGVEDVKTDVEKELNQVKYLAQLLADAVVLGGDYQDRLAALMEVELPSWLDTDGWPAELAALVRPEPAPAAPVAAEPAPPWDVPQAEEAGALTEQEKVELAIETGVATPAPVEVEEDEEDLHRPMALTKPKARPVETAEPSEVLADPTPAFKAPADKDDLFARIQAKGMEKGVDLSGIGLKPASEVAQPVAKEPEPPAPEPDPEPEAEAPLVPEVDIRADVPSNACPNCGDELVAGECWSC